VGLAAVALGRRKPQPLLWRLRNYGIYDSSPARPYDAGNPGTHRRWQPFDSTRLNTARPSSAVTRASAACGGDCGQSKLHPAIDHEGHKRLEFGGVIYESTKPPTIMDCHRNHPLVFFMT
jgi:hypothetical protein